MGDFFGVVGVLKGRPLPLTVLVQEALSKARAIAKSAEVRGPEVASAAIAFNDEGEVAVFAQKITTYGKSLKDDAIHYIAHLEDENSRIKSLKMPQLLNQWNPFKQEANQQLRPRPKKSIEWWSLRFSSDFAQLKVAT